MLSGNAAFLPVDLSALLGDQIHASQPLRYIRIRVCIVLWRHLLPSSTEMCPEWGWSRPRPGLPMAWPSSLRSSSSKVIVIVSVSRHLSILFNILFNLFIESYILSITYMYLFTHQYFSAPWRSTPPLLSKGVLSWFIDSPEYNYFIWLSKSIPVLSCLA